MARRDEEGFFYIVDRMKDMIITGGENVYSREVEEVIYTHPRVSEAAVIGLPDPTWGESVTAVVVLRRGMTATEAEIIARARDRLAGFKKPKRVIFIDELPKNVSGKILKRELRDRFTDKQLKEHSVMATVETVKGPIDTNGLGQVLMHEHVFVLSPEIDQNYPACDEEAEVETPSTG